MSIRIDRDRCIRCGACREICPGNLIRQAVDGTAYLRHPEECWGCASCLKECRHDAIFYFLGADIGGQGSRMQTNREGDLTHWIISSPGREPFTITVDRRESNKY